MITVDEIMTTETHTLPATATVADAWVPRSALLREWVPLTSTSQHLRAVRIGFWDRDQWHE